MSKKLREFLVKELQNLESAGLYQEGVALSLGSPQGSRIKVGSKEVVNFANDNYLGWANDKRLSAASMAATEEYGTSWASGRVVTGTHALHRKVEERLSKLLQTESSAIFSTEYQAAIGIFESLFTDQDNLFCDFSLQPALVDGIRLCSAKQFISKPQDAKDLEDKLKRSAGARFRAIVTESVSPHDGKLADLPTLCGLAEKYDAIVVLGDSHGIGVLGEKGRGATEHHHLLGKIDLITGGFGHALGAGDLGFISGRKDIIDWLRQKSRTYLFSCTPSPAMTGAAEKALELLEGDSLSELKRLRESCDTFRTRLVEKGFDVARSVHPIVSIVIGDAVLAQTAANRLLQKGFYVLGFCYPVVPRGSAGIRVQISAAHSRQELNELVAAFEEVGKALRLI